VQTAQASPNLTAPDHFFLMATINSSSLIYEITSIVERIDPAKLFPKVQPLEVELGCGDSSFLVEYAQAMPPAILLGWNGCWAEFKS
jgi:hypothetical protein